MFDTHPLTGTDDREELVIKHIIMKTYAAGTQKKDGRNESDLMGFQEAYDESSNTLSLQYKHIISHTRTRTQMDTCFFFTWVKIVQPHQML